LEIAEDDDFGIGLAAKGMAERLELAANFAEVIDFAVEDDPYLPGRIGHRLVSGGAEVQDRKAAKAEARRAGRGDISPLVIGAAMSKYPRHAQEPVAIHWRAAPEIILSGYATHCRQLTPFTLSPIGPTTYVSLDPSHSQLKNLSPAGLSAAAACQKERPWEARNNTRYWPTPIRQAL